MRTVRTKPNIGMERAFVENATLVDSMNREARHFNGDVVHLLTYSKRYIYRPKKEEGRNRANFKHLILTEYVID